MKSKYENGFTLYELLVTMLVIGIVMTIGIPNMSAFTANSRMAATANDLHSSFMLARSEAARSKAIITICASADSLAPTATCNGTFDDGWIIFVDLDGGRIGGIRWSSSARGSVHETVNVCPIRNDGVRLLYRARLEGLLDN